MIEGDFIVVSKDDVLKLIKNFFENTDTDKKVIVFINRIVLILLNMEKHIENWIATTRQIMKLPSG